MSADRRGPECPSVEDLSALLDGELRGEKAAALGRHVDACADCAALARRLDTASRMVRALPREEAAPERVREVARLAAEARRARAPRWLGWAAAATILLGSIVMFRLTQVVAPQVAMVQESPARVQLDKKSKADARPMAGSADAPAATAVAAAAAAPEPVAPEAEAVAPPAFADRQSRNEGMAQAELAVAPPASPPGEMVRPALGEDSEAPAKLAKDDIGIGSGVGAVLDPREADDALQAARADTVARDAAEARARANAELAATQASRRAAVTEEGKRQKKAEALTPPPMDQPGGAASGPLDGGRAETIAPAARVPSFDEDELAAPARTCTGRERLAPEERPLALVPAMQPPVLLERITPTWPAAPPPQGVAWRVIIEADGRVTPCAAPAGVSPATDAAARAALARWRFRPARLDGRPQATWADLDPR